MDCADIAVIGAGPAGAAAAIVAARNGLDVVVIDKATFPRDKCCGDGLTAACLRELQDLGLDPALVASWQPVHQVVLHSPAQRRVNLSLPRGPGLFSVVARRKELDTALVELAAATGAQVRTGQAVNAISVAPDGRVVVSTDSMVVCAPVVIAADGMWSPTRKLCQVRHEPGYRGEWHAFRQYLTGSGPDAAHAQHIWFPRDLLPGYVWSFPLPDGALNVGFGLPRGGPLAVGDGAAIWRAIFNRPEITDVLGTDLQSESPMRAWPIPARVEEATLSALGGRVLFVGDAATAPDPMTGEGIGQALQTGRLAVEAVLGKPGHSSGDIAMTYGQAVARDLVSDHRLARRLSAVLASPRRAEWALRAADAHPWTRRNFARWMFEDYPRAIIGTPRRWERGQFHRPGAYASHAGPTSETSKP